MASQPTDVIEDWTYGPLRWICAGLVIGAASVGAAWSVASRRTPITPLPRGAETSPSAPASTSAAAPLPKPAAKIPTEPVPPKAQPAFVTELAPREAVPAAPQAAAMPTPMSKLVNVNIATQQELEALPGIGPSLAARIIEDRSKFGRYKTVQDLDRVKGIGPKMLEKLRPLIVVE